ncbi:MAG: diaminopimelate epimerase [bacterium]
MDRIPFFKMSACGNDFCLIDNRDGIFPQPARPAIRSICRRRISLGADGVILVENSNIASFKMRYYNADGGEVEMCGNGARCIARFAYLNGISPQKMSFETRAGLIEAVVSEKGAKIKISDVKFSPQEGRISLPDVISDHDVYFLVVGVPHVICFVNDPESIDVMNLGRKIRYHTLFEPKGTNANFIKIVGPGSLMIRTYERGVEEETLACGTGATASAIAATALELVSPPVEVMTRSRCPLKIDFKRKKETFSPVWLEGEARVVCSGELWLDENALE